MLFLIYSWTCASERLDKIQSKSNTVKTARFSSFYSKLNIFIYFFDIFGKKFFSVSINTYGKILFFNIRKYLFFGRTGNIHPFTSLLKSMLWLVRIFRAVRFTQAHRTVFAMNVAEIEETQTYSITKAVKTSLHCKSE